MARTSVLPAHGGPTTVPEERRAPALAVGLTLVLLVLVPDNGVPPVYFTGAAVACCAALLGTVRPDSRLDPRLGLLVAFYLLAFGATLAAGEAHRALSLLRFASLIVLLAWAASRLGPRGVGTVRRVVVGLAGTEAAIALLQKLRGTPRVWGWLGDQSAAAFGVNPLWSPATGRSPGTMGHGIPLSLLLGVALILLVTTDVVRRRALRVGLALLLAAGILATGTRSAVVVLAATALWSLFFMRRGARPHPFLKVVTAVAGVVALLTVDVDNLPLFSSLRGSASFDHRSSSWETLWALLTEQPLGRAALGNGWMPMETLAQQGLLRSTVVLAADNTIVTVVMVAGVAGLVVLAVLLGVAFRGADRSARVCLVFLAGMFLSFDVVLWAAPMALLVVFAFMPPGPVGGERHPATP